MTIAPIFELLIVLAITALGFLPMTDNYTTEREKVLVLTAARELATAGEKIQAFCDNARTDCTGATFAKLLAAGFITASESARYTAEISVVSTGVNNAFVLEWTAPAAGFTAANSLNTFRNSAGAYTNAATANGFMCFSPQSAGVYASTAATCT